MSQDVRHDPYVAFRFRDFRLYLAANVLGTIGYAMQSMAIGWELYDRTGSALSLGLVGLVQVVPFLICVLPAGQLADRVSRHHIVMAVQASQMGIAFGLALVSLWKGPVGLVYALLACAGTARGFSIPARGALVPELVPLEALPNAIAWRTSTWQIATIIGPSLGGLVIGGTGRATAVFFIFAAMGPICLGMLAAMTPRPRPRTTETLSWQSLLAGIGFVRLRPLLLAAMTLDMFAVLLGGAEALLPIFTRDILRVGPSGLGWLQAAPSVGALAMALLLAHRPSPRRAGRALLLSVAGFGAAILLLALSRSFTLSLIALGLSGAFDMISVVIRTTLVQVLTPESMRGRVSAVNAVFVGMSNELGSFESGVTAAWLGPIGSVLLGGSGCLLVVGIVMITWPQLARLGSLSDLRPDSEGAPR